MPGNRKYTATDIENYHRGRMSAAEMNDMEKAALDDPFLAEAIEGYTVTPVNITADITELKQRLGKRVGSSAKRPGKLISMPWLRAAAIIIFIAGAGYLVYQFAFDKTTTEPLASNEKKQSPSIDSLKSLPVTDTQQAFSAAEDQNKNKTQTGLIEKTSVNSGKTTKQPAEINLESDLAAERVNEEKEDVKPVTPQIEKTGQQTEKIESLAKDESKKEKEPAAGAAKTYDNYETKGITAKRSGPNRNQQNLNYFRGRVTDESNNPLPFANITTTRYNVGTYADVNGNFNLVSADTVLDVQVKSVGFESYNIQLRDDLPENRIVLQEDKQVSPIVLNQARTNTESRSGYLQLNVEEPEPLDGWENYDTYLANNLKVPEEIKKKSKPGSVQVSFEVNKDGEPVNIKIERSLCKRCDQEAIRLVKEGPRWKRKNKKGRALVTIPFADYHE